jgi:hypothetical protein
LRAQGSFDGSPGAVFETGGLRPVNISEILFSSFRKDSTLVYEWMASLQDWTLTQKFCYLYDGNGLETKELIYSRSGESWEPSKMLENQFDNGNLLIFQNESQWVQDMWQPLYRKNFTYNIFGEKSEEIIHVYNGGSWIPQTKALYTFNSSIQPTERVVFTWKGQPSLWTPDNRVLFEYNENSFLSREVFQVWNDSLDMWENSISRDYSYDAENKLINTLRSQWDHVDSSWVGISILELEYYENGKVKGTSQIQIAGSSGPLALLAQDAVYDSDGNLDELIQSSWDHDQGIWNAFEKQDHFWSEHIGGNLGAGKPDITCQFANPFIYGLPWFCTSLKADQIYTARVFDLWGREHYRTTFKGDHPFRILAHLEPGMYVVHLEGGLDVHSEKLLVNP